MVYSRTRFPQVGVFIFQGRVHLNTDAMVLLKGADTIACGVMTLDTSVRNSAHFAERRYSLRRSTMRDAYAFRAGMVRFFRAPMQMLWFLIKRGTGSNLPTIKPRHVLTEY